jgi:ATP-dependent Lon protease
VALYSLFNAKPIINDVAITGEICLNGEITAIGGLEHKITGGIRAGIKTFLYPKANHREFEEWANKDNNLAEYGGKIRFIEVSGIQEALEIACPFSSDNQK